MLCITFNCTHFVHKNTFYTYLSFGKSMYLSAVNMCVKHESVFYRVFYSKGSTITFFILLKEEEVQKFCMYVKRHSSLELKVTRLNIYCLQADDKNIHHKVEER